jgi:hypothetical protein
MAAMVAMVVTGVTVAVTVVVTEVTVAVTVVMEDTAMVDMVDTDTSVKSRQDDVFSHCLLH